MNIDAKKQNNIIPNTNVGIIDLGGDIIYIDVGTNSMDITIITIHIRRSGTQDGRYADFECDYTTYFVVCFYLHRNCQRNDDGIE